MNNLYFISDTHFNSEVILKMEDRPYSSVEDMNNHIINNWNSIVSKYDTVIHLGDVACEDCNFLEISKIISKLNGHKILIMGNHDRNHSKKYWEQVGFDEVYEYPIILDRWYFLSHEPMYMNIHMPYVNIFGHVHGNPLYKDCSTNGFCACVERIGFTPVNFMKIKGDVERSKNTHFIEPIARAKEVLKKADRKYGDKLQNIADNPDNFVLLDKDDVMKLLTLINMEDTNEED